jgi:hypothetical protein
MKKRQIYFLAIMFATLLYSCSKEESSSSNNTNTTAPNGPGLAQNVQPTGCGTYNPIYKSMEFDIVRNGNTSDILKSSLTGKDTVINGKTYHVTKIVSNGSTINGYMRKDGTKVYSFSFQPRPFELIIFDDSKTNVGDKWDAGSFSLTQQGVTVTNMYTYEVVKKYANYQLSTGLSFNDVVEVKLTLSAKYITNGQVTDGPEYDGGTQYYAKCVGIIKTFTKANPTFGMMEDLNQEVMKYKM